MKQKLSKLQPRQQTLADCQCADNATQAVPAQRTSRSEWLQDALQCWQLRLLLGHSCSVWCSFSLRRTRTLHAGHSVSRNGHSPSWQLWQQKKVYEDSMQTLQVTQRMQVAWCSMLPCLLIVEIALLETTHREDTGQCTLFPLLESRVLTPSSTAAGLWVSGTRGHSPLQLYTHAPSSLCQPPTK